MSLKVLSNKLIDKFGKFTTKYFEFQLREDQELLATEILYRFLARKRHTINISLCRQVGKTELVVYLLLFILMYFDEVIGERIRVCITAPEKGTSTEFFDRLKLVCSDFGVKLKQENNDVIMFPSGNRVDKFGLFKQYSTLENKRTTREGRTFHIVIRDEKHMGDDYIYNDELIPATATTGGIDILIGNGGFKNCRAKQISDMFPDKSEILQTEGAITNFEIGYDKMKELMIAEYNKTGNDLFMRWVDSQDAYIEEHGLQNNLVRKNLFNEWFTDISNFISTERLHKLRHQGEQYYSNEIDIGLDLAKTHDRTVLTVTDTHTNIRDWLFVNGEYTVQVQAIKDYLIDLKEKGFELRYMFVDGTGVGDPIVAMLREAVGHLITVRSIVFSTKEKDIMARKGLLTFSAELPQKRLSYPADHKLARFFEQEMTHAVMEYREDGKINVTHPKTHDAHDDTVQSYLLSIYKITSLASSRAFDSNTIDN